jgi:hypothetical protein
VGTKNVHDDPVSHPDRSLAITLMLCAPSVSGIQVTSTGPPGVAGFSTMLAEVSKPYLYSTTSVAAESNTKVPYFPT